MALEELPAIINFLYKDEELASSFSAQIFSGLLKEVQEEFEDQERGDYRLKGKLPLIGADIRTEELSKSIKREITSPHDLLYLDLLHKLHPYMQYDLSKANFGDIVVVKGDIFFFSSELMQLAMEAFITIIQNDLEQVLGLKEEFAGGKKKKKKEKQIAIHLGDLVRKILDIPQFSSRYVLFTEENQKVSGFIKPNFLTIPHSAITLNFGDKPIPNVILVGIYETTENSGYEEKFDPNSFDFISYEVLKAFAQLRREEGYTVRPILIYYPVPIQPLNQA